MDYSVSDVAALSGVTVRTLHHYDDIGLLPSTRLANGYRRYSEHDLALLQRILFYRELEFELDEIKRLLAGEADPLVHMHRQHDLLVGRRARLDQLLRTLEHTMNAQRAGVNLTADELLEVFGEYDPTEYHDEAEARWGDTEAWKQSQERTLQYTKDDWKRIKAQTDELMERTVAAFEAGAAPDSEQAMDLAEEARAQMDSTYFDLTHGRHRCLGAMYVADDRFAAHYNNYAEGLATWFRDAIYANAERHGVHEDTWD